MVEAAANNDIELLLACSVVAVVVVLATQLISDFGYIYLNPRIRVSGYPASARGHVVTY